MIDPHPPALMSELCNGSKFRVEPHPGTIEVKPRVTGSRKSLTQAVTPRTNPFAQHLHLKRIGEDFIRLTQDAVSSETGHPPIILHHSYCAFIGV